MWEINFQNESVRDSVKTVKKRISDLCTTYSSNLNEDTTELLFEREELAGVPEDLVNSFEKVKHALDSHNYLC